MTNPIKIVCKADFDIEKLKTEYIETIEKLKAEYLQEKRGMLITVKDLKYQQQMLVKQE